MKTSFSIKLLSLPLYLGACIASYAATDLEEVRVVATPIQSDLGIDASRMAAHVQQVTAAQLDAAGTLDLSSFLNNSLGSVHINQAQNNPLQPDLQFRGYTASPLLGLPQGIAVYQNGARINEPLGDAVSWDLLPQSAISSVTLSGGANPLFGLNTLGGALSLQMKNGFNYQGNALEVGGGSFGRITTNVESGNNNGEFGYYINLDYFNEQGWRDLSESDAMNFWGTLSWRSEASHLDLSGAYAKTRLFGNGPSPVGLLEIDREAFFTAPDITENNMHMLILEGTHLFSETTEFAGNLFYRQDDTDSFNGDSSDFQACEFTGGRALLDGIETDDVEALGLDLQDLCDGTLFTGAEALEDFLNMTATDLGYDEEFNIEDLTDSLYGTGIIADEAINNISSRGQESIGISGQMTFMQDLFKRDNQLIVGYAYFEGDSTFDSVVELADLGADRSTQGLGTGTFLDEGATSVSTSTESWSLFFTDTLDLSERLSLTIGGRYNNTDVSIRDRSGERPELNGDHNFSRFNPMVGLTFDTANDQNLYVSYSESTRAPTPIELSCNDAIFDEAQRLAELAGEDPEDVEFECRLPNAFLADPPLDQVVASSVEAGMRGIIRDMNYHLGFFHTSNKDDIIFQTTGRSTGLFANVDETRRLGFESALSGEMDLIDWYLSYSYVQATFEDNFLVLSPNHPFADEDGQITVSKGDRIPGIPEHQFKGGLTYDFMNGLSLGAEVVFNSEQYLRGDESNQLDTVDSFYVLNLRAAYQVNERFQVFARVNNALNRKYESFGLLGDDPGEVLDLNNNLPYFLGAGAPIGGWVGMKLML